MIHWAWLILAFAIGITFAVFTYELVDYNTIFTEIICGIAYPFVWIAMWFIKPFQNIIYPVTQNRWIALKNNKAFMKNLTHYHLFKNIWLCHDSEAKHIQARWFFVRVKGDNE